MKKISEALKRKWPEYLIEVMAIIIGIIGAFMVDSWHDERKIVKLEREDYFKMIADLQ